MTLTDIKWDVFTLEERAMIEKLVASGHFGEITHAIQMNDLEKEYWVAKILAQVLPEPKPIDSEVEKELLLEKTKGNEIDSPEKEAEWQKKLDEEKKGSKTKLAKRAKEEKEKNLKSLETALDKAKPKSK